MAHETVSETASLWNASAKDESECHEDGNGPQQGDKRDPRQPVYVLNLPISLLTQKTDMHIHAQLDRPFQWSSSKVQNATAYQRSPDHIHLKESRRAAETSEGSKMKALAEVVQADLANTS